MKAQCKVMSPKHEILKGRVEEVDLHEMQALLCKLKNLVPNVPRNKRLSRLEIIQYVIDYILDLQIALETHPASSRPTPSIQNLSSNRQPLGVLSPSINTCAAQEVNQTEKIPITEVIAAKRPVSC